MSQEGRKGSFVKGVGFRVLGFRIWGLGFGGREYRNAYDPQYCEVSFPSFPDNQKQVCPPSGFRGVLLEEAVALGRLMVTDIVATTLLSAQQVSSVEELIDKLKNEAKVL